MNKLLKISTTAGLAICITAVIGYIILSAFRVQDTSIISSLLTHYARQNFHWHYKITQQQSLTDNSSVTWTQLTATDKAPKLIIHGHKNNNNPLRINIIDADLADKNIKLTPVLANTINPKTPHLETLVSMGNRNQNLIAGINGGYFFQNKPGKSDQNCLSKSYPQTTTQGVGDGSLIINNQSYATNCSNRFWSEANRSTIMQNNNSKWSIDDINNNAINVISQNALGAGPGLIETINNKPEIIMRWEGILSTFEYSANTAVILAKDNKDHMHVIFFTVDGEDKKSGMTSMAMANFIYTQIPNLLNVKLTSAMSMDQGHSTTMYVKNSKNKIVSKSSTRGSPRAVYDALFIKSEVK